mgnify:CR=1 FL=1
MVKPILTVTYYSRRHRSVQSTAMDCTDCPGGLYSPPEETVAANHKSGLSPVSYTHLTLPTNSLV